MTKLSIDIETFSSTSLKDVGTYKYVEDPDFEILLFAYAFGDDIPEIVDLASGEQVPDKILKALTDPAIKKKAFNANFERTCLNKFFDLPMHPEQWECTMVKSAMLGLPMSLEQVAKVLGLADQKITEGKALIRYFCIPCKPTKSNKFRSRNQPEHAPEKWLQFKNYCGQDVVLEQSISERLDFYQIPKEEVKLWELDQLINDRGVFIDRKFVTQAVGLYEEYRQQLLEEAIAITGMDNPNSGPQLKKWLTTEIGEEVTTLNKETLPVLLKAVKSDVIKRVLEIRQELGKTSISKYYTMLDTVCSDGRIRGLLQFCGANRTWRWAGRLVQVQNLKRNEIDTLDIARSIVLKDNYDWLLFMYGDVMETLSQLIRTSFVAPSGHRLMPSDFSAIEARVIAWLAGEPWRMEVFNTHGKIYEASAAKMFKVSLESISYKDKNGKTVKGPNYDLRYKGKLSELSLGFNGGPGALIKMGALKMGLEESELPDLVALWRNENTYIVKLWKDVQKAAIAATRGNPQKLQYGLHFFRKNDTLYIQLPSGRRLAYYRPELVDGEYGPNLTYMGMDQTTKQWKRIYTYGGKLVENIVQAIERDCLATAMLRVHAAGYKIVMHVHDELVLEVPDGWGSIDEVNKIMGQAIPWAPGLPLKAESYETHYYKKD